VGEKVNDVARIERRATFSFIDVIVGNNTV